MYDLKTGPLNRRNTLNRLNFLGIFKNTIVYAFATQMVLQLFVFNNKKNNNY